MTLVPKINWNWLIETRKKKRKYFLTRWTVIEIMFQDVMNAIDSEQTCSWKWNLFVAIRQLPSNEQLSGDMYTNRKDLLSLCSVCGYLEPFAWLLLMLKLEISAGTTKYISNGKTKVPILNSIFLQFQGEHKLLLKLIHRIRCTLQSYAWYG